VGGAPLINLLAPIVIPRGVNRPSLFFFQIFAENYYRFVQTRKEKEREMDRKEKEENLVLGKVFPAKAYPTPPGVRSPFLRLFQRGRRVAPSSRRQTV
jgi:hypothetical protein